MAGELSFFVFVLLLFIILSSLGWSGVGDGSWGGFGVCVGVWVVITCTLYFIYEVYVSLMGQ